uniref:Uncharacterized protein n=1 Tax=Arundo donax TaxID=35708 RepID=A0A0A9CE08_ARUDO
MREAQLLRFHQVQNIPSTCQLLVICGRHDEIESCLRCMCPCYHLIFQCLVSV